MGSANPSRRRGAVVGSVAPTAGAASTPTAPTARPAATPPRSNCRRVRLDASINTSGTCGASEAAPEPSLLDDRAEDERMALPFHDRSSLGVGTSMLGSFGHRARGTPWPTPWSAALSPSQGAATATFLNRTKTTSADSHGRCSVGRGGPGSHRPLASTIGQSGPAARRRLADLQLELPGGGRVAGHKKVAAQEAQRDDQCALPRVSANGAASGPGPRW